MNAKAFVVATGVVVATVALALPSINVLVDPFQVFGGPQISGINVRKPVASTRARLSKNLSICRLQPDLVILGSSRAEFISIPIIRQSRESANARTTTRWRASE